MEWERRSGKIWSRGKLRPSAQEACAEDPGCAHGKFNSELLLHHKSRAAGSFPREQGEKAQEQLGPDGPTLQIPLRVGPRCAGWGFGSNLVITFIYKLYTLLKCTHLQKRRGSILHQKAGRLELL